MLPKKLAFVDLETTGVRATFDRIIEIGILRVEEGKLKSTYQSLVNPGFYIPADISLLTGISQSQIEEAPSFYDIKDNILEILDQCIFVAHNVRFDYSFLKNEFKRLGINFSPKLICTVKLSRKLYPEFKNHNLDSIIARLNLRVDQRHRAFDDALAIWKFYERVVDEFKEEKIAEYISLSLKSPTLPINLKDKEILYNLPEGPGVYIFYGRSGLPLYIGKSINLRERVLSHFAADHRSSKEMAISQQIESIETVSTVGELGALFLENKLIKKMQPLYNSKQRAKRGLTQITHSINELGYETVSVEKVDEIKVLDLDKFIGIFKSDFAAKQFLISVSKEYNLCEKLLNLEKSSKSCFGYRLGRCKGACIGKESPGKYNLRFLEATISKRIKQWPFKGAVLIKEENTDEKTKEFFLVDRWCLLGSFKSEDELNFNQDYFFDLDAYRILLRYLGSLKNHLQITNIELDKSGEKQNLEESYYV